MRNAVEPGPDPAERAFEKNAPPPAGNGSGRAVSRRALFVCKAVPPALPKDKNQPKIQIEIEPDIK